MFQIKIADLIITIHNKYDYVVNLCKDYIVDGETADFEVSVSDEDIKKEQAESEQPFPLEYCESICLYRAINKQLIHFNGFLMHAACIEKDGKSYAFCAKSGTGKSTHLCLWKKVFGDDVRIINGDKPIIRYINNQFLIYGTPWCGKEGWNINTSSPLAGICFLERGQNNKIERYPASQAMTRLCHQILMPRDPLEMSEYLSMIDVLLRNIPVHLLHCNMEEEAALVSCRGLEEAY